MEPMNAQAGHASRGVGRRGTTPTDTAGRSALKSNVNRLERTASVLLGGALLIRGLTRPSLAGAGLAVIGGGLLNRGITGRSYLYKVLGTSTATGDARHAAGVPADAPQVERTITIGKPADELYRFWREPRNLSRIMGHFAEVTAASEDRTHWLVHGPLGRSVEWDAQVVEDRPGEFLRWESLEEAKLRNEGSVSLRPAPGDWGTEVTLRFRFDPPGGAIGKAALKRLGAVPGTLAGRALRRLKSLVETGEIPTTERNPSARSGARGD